MKINILKNKYLKNGLIIILGTLAYSLYSYNTSYATKTEPYYFGVKASEYEGFVDEDIPPAVRLIKSVDGMPVGTILYKTQYLNFTYYTPATPKELQGTDKEDNPTKYRKWGPWEMPGNQVAYEESVAGTIVPGFIPSSYTYSKVTIAKGSTIEGIKTNSLGVDYRVELGTLTSAFTGKPKSITNYKASGDPHIYFNLSGTNLKGKGSVDIGRIPVASATVSGKINLYYSDTRPIYDNFSKYGRYSDSTEVETSILSDSSHENIELGKWLNPSYAPYDLAGKKGEWKLLGYNSDGDPVTNPYSLDESLYFRGNSAVKDYDIRYTPWNPNDDKDGETETKKVEASEFFPALTRFDTDKKFYDLKYELIKRLFNEGLFKRKLSTLDDDIKDMLKRVSFRNHPVHESTVIRVQRRIGTSTRFFTVFNELSDMYLHSMSVTDSSGTTVASYSYNVKTGVVTKKDGEGIIAGEKYTVKVYLGNAKNKAILATKNQAEIGLKSNYKDFEFLPISSTTDTQSKEVANTIGDTKGSKSSVIKFTITAPNADFFDIYGYVGYKHLGTDNLDESNDVGRIRMNINGTDYTEQYEYSHADLVAKKIEFLDENGNIAYSYTRGASSPSINNAIIPGKSYTIKYTIVNEGNEAKYRVRSAGSWSGNNWIPGSWGGWIYYDCYVNSRYAYTRIGSNTLNANDVVPSKEQFTVSNEIPVTNGVSNVFKIYANTQLTYTRDNVVFEYPYVDTSFSFTTNTHANKDTTNDSLDVVIKPTYDATISNVRIHPINEYTDGGSRKTSYLITYDANLNVDGFMNSNDVTMLVETSINIGGKTVSFPDLLTVGSNKNISHSVNDVTISSSGVMTATVFLNYNEHTYETNYINNKATGTTSIRLITSPFNGKNTDKATGTDNSDGSLLMGGGSLNNNCLITRTKNNWSVTHRKVAWSSTNKSYVGADGLTKTFKKYSISSDTTLSPINYYETFNIESILFRSKDTMDKKLGTDGWIDLLNASQKDLATIKAGYGFELKVISKYKTNVKNTMPSLPNYVASSSGNFYNNTSKDANINLPKDIYIELPGSNSTRKILSVTGFSGTTQGINVQETDESTSSETIKKFTYTIKATNTLGIKESSKIFTPTSLKDGNYKVSIYTPPIAGVPSVNKGAYSTMCDRKDVNITVKGSYTDDLNYHITQ